MRKRYDFTKGKPNPYAKRLQQVRQFSRQNAPEFLERQKEGSGDQLSDEEAMDVALAAQRAARGQLRKGKPRPKSKPKRSRK